MSDKDERQATEERQRVCTGENSGVAFSFIWTSQLLERQRQALSGLRHLWSCVSDPEIQQENMFDD